MVRNRAGRGGTITVALAIVAAMVLLGATPTSAAVPQPQTFEPVGAGVAQSYVVPAGVYSLQVTVRGGQGGPGGSAGGIFGAGGAGGLGAQVLMLVPVTPGETLTVVVGARGDAAADGTTDQPTGGGGGGALTSISRAGVPLAIAGGGGGGGGGGQGYVSMTAGGRGGESGHDGYTSSGFGPGHGGITGPLQWGGAGGDCDNADPYLVSCATSGGPGVGTAGGHGGTGELHESGLPNRGCEGMYGGDGGQGALGGGAGGGSGCDGPDSPYWGAGGGGAGGTSSLFGNFGFIFEGARQGDGEAIVVPVPGAAPPGTGLPPSAPPGSVAPIEGTAPVPVPVAVSPRFTG